MLLAIDTSTRYISLALHNGRQVLAESTWQAAERHTVELAPRIAGMLSMGGVTSASELTGLAVALGPGTFTGLRVGLALAKGLALAGPVPLVGVPSLDVSAAAQARLPGEKARLVAVLSAGRGRLFAAVYRWRGGKGAGRDDEALPLSERWECVSPPRIFTWEDLVTSVEGEPLVFCGEIDVAGAQQVKKLGRRGRVVLAAQSLRRAAYLAEMALERLARGERDDPAALVPLYLHEPGTGPTPAPAESPRQGA